MIRDRSAYRGGALEGCLVAPVTIRRIQCVIVVHMARSAGRRRRGHVRSRQSETGNAVIERRRVPTFSRMAGGTIHRRESRSSCRVHWIIRLLPGRQMATRVSAIGRRDRQRIIVVDVAQIAGHIGVPIG